MVFSNLIFLYLFLPVCLIAYFFCPGIRAKNAVLILFSLIFYAWGEPVYLLLMIASAAVNWYFGLLIERRRKKIFLILALVLDLGCLAVFKYAGFFVENLNAVFGASIPVPQIALPIGISPPSRRSCKDRHTAPQWRRCCSRRCRGLVGPLPEFRP